jgi:nucleoside phosphorylase
MQCSISDIPFIIVIEFAYSDEPGRRKEKLQNTENYDSSKKRSSEILQ